MRPQNKTIRLIVDVTYRPTDEVEAESDMYFALRDMVGRAIVNKSIRTCSSAVVTKHAIKIVSVPQPNGRRRLLR